MKTILLHIYPDAQQDARVHCALDVARTFGGHIVCLQVMSFDHFIGADPLGGIYVYGELLTAVREQERSERERIEAWLRRDGASFGWHQVDGDVARTIIAAAPLSDIVIVSQPVGAQGELVSPLPIVASVATHALGPVLALPAGEARFTGAGRAMIAWNGSAEAAHALRLSLPFLKTADKVDVVEIVDDRDTETLGECTAVQYLAHYDVQARLHRDGRGARSTAAALRDAAQRLDIAYIVMGAYGHSRMLETVVGGVTDDLTHGCPWPLLLAH